MFYFRAPVVQVFYLLLHGLVSSSIDSSHRSSHWYSSISWDSRTIPAWIFRVSHQTLLVFSKRCPHHLFYRSFCSHHASQCHLLHHFRLLCVANFKIYSKDYNVWSKNEFLSLHKTFNIDGLVLDHGINSWSLRYWLHLVCVPHPKHPPG